MNLPIANVFVEYMHEDAFLSRELFKHAHNMGIAAGYKTNYKLNGQRVDDNNFLVKHQFWDSETKEPMFDLYEMENAEARMYSDGKQVDRVSERIIQVVASPSAFRKYPHVKDDLELLCSRVFRKNPDWITAEEAPIPVEKEKMGCAGFIYSLLQFR